MKTSSDMWKSCSGARKIFSPRDCSQPSRIPSGVWSIINTTSFKLYSLLPSPFFLCSMYVAIQPANFVKSGGEKCFRFSSFYHQIFGSHFSKCHLKSDEYSRGISFLFSTDVNRHLFLLNNGLFSLSSENSNSLLMIMFSNWKSALVAED